MANMLDYLAWRGDLTLDRTPFCPLDALLMATLSYLGFHGTDDARGWTLEEARRIDLLQPGTSPAHEGRTKIFRAMAESERFRDVRIHHQFAMTDAQKEMQFSAMCLDLPDGTMCVAFRGTDNTIVGWREDFNMAYQDKVAGQEAACYYLKRAAELTDRPLRIAGHSKGGNLGVYAASFATAELQDRISEIWAFDAPGMNPTVSALEGYTRIRGKIRSYIPQTSIIGLLMDFYTPYTVVRSTSSGISQHDPASWQVYGPRFVEVPEIDRTAKVVCETLHDWLATSTEEQRGAFVDTLFQLVDTTGATRMSDLTGEKIKSLMVMVGNRKEVDPETRRVFNRLMAQAVTLGFGKVKSMVRGRNGENGDESAAPEKDGNEPESPLDKGSGI